MKIESGGIYARRDGEVVGPAKRNPATSYHGSTSEWFVGCNAYRSDGRLLASREDELDLVTELDVVPVLPFTLEAGKRYVTTKPDGSEGPVVMVRRPSFAAESLFREVPFIAEYAAEQNFVNRHGELFTAGDGVFARITAEYIEPPPPTIAERLEAAVADVERNNITNFAAKVDSFVTLVKEAAAELRALEGSKKC